MGGSNVCDDCKIRLFCLRDESVVSNDALFHGVLDDFDVAWMALCTDEESTYSMSESYVRKIDLWWADKMRYYSRNYLFKEVD